MKKIGQFTFTAAGVIALATVLYLAPWFAGIAHAATDPSAAIVAATNSLGWPVWFGIIAAAIACIKATVDALLAFFRYLAPQTKTTVDDRIRDDLQLAHDKLDGLTQLVQGIAKPVAVTVQNVTAPAATNSAPTSKPGFTRLSVMLMIAAAGIAVLAAAGCAGSQATRTTTIASLDSGIQTATAALRTYEHEHAESLIAAAADKASAQASLAAFRAKVDKAWLAVDTARAAIDAANTLNDDASLAGAKTAIDNALAAITALTGGTTP